MNEFQNAYELSRIEYRSSDETGQMHKLYLEGKAVVGIQIEICCKFTDALIAYENHIVKVFESWEAAAEFCHEEGDDEYFIYAPHEEDVVCPNDQCELHWKKFPGVKGQPCPKCAEETFTVRDWENDPEGKAALEDKDIPF